MDFFGTTESLEQLKGEYLKYLNKWKGSDIMVDVKKQYEERLYSLGIKYNEQVDEENKTLPAEKQRKHFDASADMFAETLDKVIDFNMKIEIIGQWIWCFDSYEYHEQLKELGFWYTKSKKAWVFNGERKKFIRSRNKIDDLRKKWGSEQIREREEA